MSHGKRCFLAGQMEVGDADARGIVLRSGFEVHVKAICNELPEELVSRTRINKMSNGVIFKFGFGYNQDLFYRPDELHCVVKLEPLHTRPLVSEVFSTFVHSQEIIIPSGSDCIRTDLHYRLDFQLLPTTEMIIGSLFIVTFLSLIYSFMPKRTKNATISSNCTEIVHFAETIPKSLSPVHKNIDLFEARKAQVQTAKHLSFAQIVIGQQVFKAQIFAVNPPRNVNTFAPRSVESKYCYSDDAHLLQYNEPITHCRTLTETRRCIKPTGSSARNYSSRRRKNAVVESSSKRVRVDPKLPDLRINIFEDDLMRD